MIAAVWLEAHELEHFICLQKAETDCGSVHSLFLHPTALAHEMVVSIILVGPPTSVKYF